MADPLSIAASIAGLVTLADVVFLRLTKYVISVKGAEKEIDDLRKEVNLLGGAVNMLARLATGLEMEDEPFNKAFRMYHIEGCASILSEISKKTKRYEESHGQGLRRLMWPFTSMKTKEMLADLSRHKESINLALSANSMEALLRGLAKEEDKERTTAAILADVQKTREIVSRIYKDAGRQRVLDFFLSHNPQQSYEMSVRLRHPRTGMWLDRLPSFQTWLSCPDSRLWLSGIPGAGKTVLAGSIIGQALARSSNTVATGFFFCDYKNETTLSPESVLGALAYQLAIQKEEAYEILEEYFEDLHPESSLPRHPAPEDLGRVIVQMTQEFDQVFLIVDGLDECGDTAEEIIENLCVIAEHSDSVSMALLSRHEDAIRERLQDYEDDFVGIEIEAHTEDITEYVTSQIEQRISSKKLHFEDLSLKTEILEGLVAGAKGMFRWVACQLDHLGHCMSDEQCREALRGLPPDLPETYLRILQRVPKTQQAHVRLVLLFISYAEPKLSIAQMREILSIPTRDRLLKPSGIIREDAISRPCSSLIRKSNDGDYFEFAHFSVQEYLKSDALKASDLEMFTISRSRCNRLLATRCLDYLQLDNFQHFPAATEDELSHMRRRSRNHPLYDYAAKNCLPHAREEWDDPDVLDRAKRLFDPCKSAQFTSWAVALTLNLRSEDLRSRSGEVSRTDKEVKLIEDLVDESFKPLHLAATLSLPEMCSFLMDQTAQYESRSPFGSPLECAVDCLYGALRLFWSETEHRRRHGTMPPKFQRFLGTAASQESFTVSTIRRIMAKGAKPSGNPIRLATTTWMPMRSFSVLEALLAGGQPLVQDDLDCFSKAMLSFEESQVDTSLGSFCQFLNSMIDVTPSHLELCRLAWKYVLKLDEDFARLEHDTMDIRVTKSQEALTELALTACRELDTNTLQTALDDQRMDAPSIVDSDGENTLLHIVSMTEFNDWLDEDEWVPKASKTVDMLLKAGCSLSKRNERGHTPFSLALEDGEAAMASILLEKSKDDPAAWESPVPVLLLVAESGSEDILEQLLGMGWEFQAADYERETPLHRLKANSSLALVARLKHLFPDSCERRMDGRLPVELYLDNAFVADHFSPDMDVLDSLIQPLLDRPDDEDLFKTWEHFTSGALANTHLLKRTAVDQTVMWFVRNGTFHRYERFCQRSALVPLIEACPKEWAGQYDCVANFPLKAETLCTLLEETGYWPKLRESPLAIRLLQMAVNLNYEVVVSRLLSQGVGAHRRLEGVSVLEHVCKLPASQESDIARLRWVLEHSDTTLLNETNPESGLGLIHLSNEGDTPHFRQQVLELLIQRGTNPNLRVAGFPQEPSMVHHLDNEAFELAHALLKLGADPTIACRNGWTAVHMAVARDALSFLFALQVHENPEWNIDWQGTCIVERESHQYPGSNLLHLASTDTVDCMRYLLDKDALFDLEAQAEGGLTAMHFAAIGRYINGIELLHSRGANINPKSSKGWLPLHYAVDSGDLGIVETLLRLGSETTANSDGMTPLLLAYEKNHLPVIDCLLRAQEVDQGDAHAFRESSNPTPPTEPSFSRARALHGAINFGNLSFCQVLLSQSGSLETDMPGPSGPTPLAVAIRLGKLDIVQWLLEQGANANQHYWAGNSTIQEMIIHPGLNKALQPMLDKYLADGGCALRQSPSLVLLAVNADNEEGLRILLDHFHQNIERYASSAGVAAPAVLTLAVNQAHPVATPLHLAVEKGNTAAVRLLIDSDANMEARDLDMDTPLLVAVKTSGRGNNALVSHLLIQAGCNPNCRNGVGATPIAIACGGGNGYLVQHLLDVDADPHVMDQDGRNILHYLFRGTGSEGIPPLFFKLTEMGIDPHQVDNFGWSAVHLGMHEAPMAALLLNGVSQTVEDRPIPWSEVDYIFGGSLTSGAFLTSAFEMYRRRLPLDKFRTLLNLEPVNSWSPLCQAASRGEVTSMKNLLSIGASIDFEGCPEGSALMVASRSGLLESVVFLVRNGASISFQGSKRYHSAPEASARSARVLHWLLVHRFTDQRKLDKVSVESTATPEDIKHWSGITKTEMIISGAWERRWGESSKSYWSRLSRMKKGVRGEVVPRTEGGETRRPSKLVPLETVRIAAGGYQTSRGT